MSEAAFAEHTEYLNNLKLRYSILKKSEGRLAELSLPEIEKRRDIPRQIRSEAVTLLSEILAHEIYFSSFTEGGTRSGAIKESYSSEDAFLYTVLRAALPFGSGFCAIDSDFGKISFRLLREPYEIFRGGRTPKLVLDLFEHAYFRDFGHKREEYLKSALFYLDLTRLN